MADRVIKRADALTQGLEKYFTGKACKYGHVAERYTIGTNCVLCNVERQRTTYWTRDDLIAHLAKLYNNTNVISRSDALAQGKRKYFTGKPCSSGHICERWVSGWKCVKCRAAHSRRTLARWEKANPEKVRAKVQRYRARHREKWLEYKKIYNETHKVQRAEYGKKWREANPDYDHARKFKRLSPELKYQKLRERREAQKEKDLEAYKAKAVAYQSKRRARKLKSSGQHSKDDLIELLRSQRYRCVYCSTDLRKVKKHLDHIVPLSLGGGNGKDNLQWLCYKCNLKKTNKDPIQFAQEQGRLL